MKRLLLLLMCVLTVLVSPMSAIAVPPKIVDDAGLLNDIEISNLEKRAQELADRYDMDIVIVTVDSLNGKSSEAFADDYYDSNGYGMGSDYSGVLLLLSMEYRDWTISTCGETIYALTDYGVQDLFSQIAGYLSQDQFYLAFCAYLDALEPYLLAYSEGSPIDGDAEQYDGPGTYIPGTQDDIVYYEPVRDFTWYAKKVILGFAVGVVAAGIVLLVMRGQMNTAKAQRGAASYMLSNTYRVGLHSDIFLYSQISKVRKSENTSSGSGGGSSVHRSSSGRSHGGGHGKF